MSAKLTLPHLTLVTGAVLLVGAGACREVPQAPNVTPPAPAAYGSFQLDGGGPQYGDVWISWWNGVTLLQPPDQSVHVVAVDPAGDRLLYYGCANVCGEKAHWFGGMVASPGGTWRGATAALTPSGIVVAYTRTNTANGGIGMWYSTCPGACNFPSNWRTDSLFVGEYTVGDWHWGGGKSVSLSADSVGSLHLLLLGVNAGLFYGRCSSGCATEANWQVTVLDSTFSGSTSTDTRLIALDPRGVVHVLYSTGAGLTHASCAANCTSAASWQSGAVRAGVGATALSLAFDRGGGLHLAYADTSGAVTYAMCTAPCGAPGAWSSVALALHAVDVSLAVGGTGTAYLATTGSKVVLSRCAATCLEVTGWQATTVDAAPGSTMGLVSVAVDSSGHARIASTGFAGSATTGWNTLQYTLMLQ
jgi:hypothetical protein